MRMMYFISSNSGYFQYSQNVNYYYISETKGLPPSYLSEFQSFQGLAWSIKPIYGWISDSFYPFKYRIKPYIFMMCMLNALCCISIFLNAPEFDRFKYTWLVLNVSVAFIDAMAEGITAINTKLGAKIAKLQEAERRATGAIEGHEEENEMKSFGMFNIIRGILRAVTALIGGITAQKLSVNISYLILGIYPIIMILYTFLIFKEERVSPTLKFPLTNFFRKEPGSTVFRRCGEVLCILESFLSSHSFFCHLSTSCSVTSCHQTTPP
jgi:MFS family permease